MSDRRTDHTEAQSDSNRSRVRELAARAEAAGYILIRSAAPRFEWKLLDDEYREDILTTTDIDQIAEWLDS